METIVTDIIQLDSTDGINRLRKLYKGKQEKNISTNNIQCQYKDFTFTINIDDVKIPLKSEGKNDTKIIISKPKNLEFNGQPCNASEEDDKNTITIINDGEELQFENFTFNKQPYDSVKIINKTIFDNIVETGITKAFGYKKFDVNDKDKIEYNFPLHYNANGIFKIQVNENENILPKTIKIQGTEYKIDNQSAILFKKNEDRMYQKPFEYIVIDVTDDYGERRYFDIERSIYSETRKSNCTNATEMQIQYKNNPKTIIHQEEANNTPNFFTRLFDCCCNKTIENTESEINTQTLNRFENIQDIVKKEFKEM